MSFNQKERLNVQEIQFLGKRDKPDMVVIDYLGLVKPGDGKSRYEQVTNISNELKRMARNLRVPVLCLAQLNREVEGRKGDAPRLSDLRDSGAIEQDADVVMLLHKTLDEVSEYEAMPLDVIIAKNRFGPLGTASMSWYMRSGRIVESR
jgi:replicative DNA helicase